MSERYYRYDECGLDNVLLVDLPACTDDSGEDVVTIANVNQLHRLLSAEVAAKPAGLTGAELRFLRTELGLTQTELGAIVGRDAQTIGRWERGETTVEGAAETVIRVLALQHVGAAVPVIEDLARRSVATAGAPPIRIDASDPDHYRPMPLAA